MMDKGEYTRMIHSIVNNGYGFDAIKDISRILEQRWEKESRVMMDIKAEQKITRKILSTDQTTKHKISLIKDIIGTEEVEND